MDTRAASNLAHRWIEAKAEAALDEWLSDAAPSSDLRRWYGHRVERFDEFVRRYRAELRHPPASAAVDRLVELACKQPVTLLTATRDAEHSGARVLQQVLVRRAPASVGVPPDEPALVPLA